MTVRFGMAGTGAMAAAMLPAFRQAEGADLVAVSSASEARAKTFAATHGIAKAYGGFDAMLADNEIDAVYIAGLTRDHAFASITALNAGKHVLCEKPFAMTAAEGEHVIAAAKSSGKLFMEGLWTHFLPAYARAHQLAQEKTLGPASHLTAAYGYPTSPVQRPRLFAREDGGVLLDIAVYPISLALRLFGAVDHLHAEVTRNEDGVDTHASLQMHHRSGAVSQLAASFDVLTANAATIACRKGQIRIPPPLFGAEEVVVESFSPGGDAHHKESPLKSALKQISILRQLKAALGGGGERHPYGANQYLPQMAHFVGLVETGSMESNVVSHELSLDVLRVLDRIRAGERAS